MFSPVSLSRMCKKPYQLKEITLTTLFIKHSSLFCGSLLFLRSTLIFPIFAESFCHTVTPFHKQAECLFPFLTTCALIRHSETNSRSNPIQIKAKCVRYSLKKQKQFFFLKGRVNRDVKVLVSNDYQRVVKIIP